MVRGYTDASGAYRVNTRVSSSTFIYRPENVFVEDNVYVGHYTVLDGSARLAIGEGTQVSAWSGLLTHSSHISIRLYGRHYLECPEEQKKGYQLEPVTLGRCVFIGSRVLVLPGVTIGDGALVAAGSIVRADVAAFDVVAGDPATVVGDTREMDKAYLEDDPQLLAWYTEWQER